MFLSRILCSCSTVLPRSSATAIVGFKSHLFDEISNRLPVQRYTRKNFTHDYCILLIQRPQTLPTFGGRIVFPGGLLSESDSSQKVWSGLKCDKLTQANMIPDTYKKLRESSCHCISKRSLDPTISFRLCAIRELFEETGLLLIENQDEPNGVSAHAVLLDDDKLQIWQNRIVNDQSELSELYSYLRCSPPIHALHEWSSWKSPPILKNRFDTMFYFVEIQRVVNHAQKHETNQRWKSTETETLYADAPPAFLQSQQDHGGYLFKSIAPPQAYELCRLVHFEKLDQLRKFSLERSCLGSRSWCPLPAKGIINSKDCLILFLPGDQRYNQIQEHWEKTNSLAKFDLTWISDTHRNRFLFDAGNSDSWFDCTVHELGHVMPINRSEFSSKFL